MATGTALAAAPSCLNAGGTAGCALGRPRWEGRSQVHVGCFDSVLLRAPGLRPLSQACRAPPLGKRRSEAPRWRASGQRVPCASSNFDGRENEQAEARGVDASSFAESSHRHGVPPAQEASTSGREFGSEGERRHTRRHPWARTAVRWASAILLGTALAVVNTQPAMAAWGFGGKGGVREAPRPGTVGLTDDQRRKQDEEAEARRAADEEAARQARSQQEEERSRARTAEQAQQEQQQAREGIIRNVEFFRERNVDTDEWELPLAVFEEAADAGLVDRSLLGWSKDTLRIRLRSNLGPLAEPEYLVIVPYTQKKRILDKYTGDVDVAAGVGLGADSPRNLFEELHYESVTGQGRGQNLARRKIDLLLKHYGEYGPFWFLSKDRIDPESLGFKDGEAAYLWIEYWVAAFLAATWVWVMFVDKDQKTERYWDVRAVKEFRRQFQGADMNSEVTLRDVAGLDHVVDELQEVITFLKHPQKFEAMGARPPRGMLLYGAPGTGKTLLARAIAGEAKVPIIHVVASKFAMGESMVGVQAARLRGMFAYAKQRAPIVIFLDEIDGLCKKRAGARTDVFREQERAVTLNQLLVEMDGFNTYANKGILLIGATNNPSTLDPALTRPGRMDRIIEMPLPDTEGRVEIMTLYNKGWQFLGPIDLYEIAERGKGLTPADLAEIYEDAISDKIDHVTTSFRQIYDIYFRKRGPYYFLHPVALIPGPWQKHIPRWFGRAFRHFFAINPEDFQPHEDHCITQADLRRTIDFISLEKESKRGQVSDKLWAPTIWHTRSFKQPFAAGLVTTAWMATLLPNHPPIISMWLEKYEGESIAVVNIGTWESTEFTEVATRRMLEKMLVVLVSGYVGLRMLLPEEMHDTLLHVRDIKHAQRLAREMCASTGFSFDDDVTMWAGSVQGEANAARHIKKTKSPAMGWAKQQELREMGDVLVNLAINKAAEILIPQKAAMEELMERLMVHDRLEKEDIEAHMRKYNVQPVDEFWLTPGGRYSIPEPEGRRFSPGGIIPDPVGTPVDLGPKRLTLAALGTKYARKYKQIIKRGGYVPADRWDDPALEGKTWVSAPDFATENVLEVTVEKAGVGQF